MSAVVALGAVACDNAIDDNLGVNNEDSLSIEVVISEATRIALTDNGIVDGKQTHKLGFEDGDKLLVSTAWGGDTENAANNFWFTYSEETGLFTCTAEGVGALKGQKRSVFHLATHPEKGLVGGVLCDSEAGLDGVALHGSTSALGEETITLTAYPILKYTSEHNVTFTASKSIFGAIKSWGIGQYAEYTFPAGTDVYVPLYSHGTMNFSASIKGEVVKEAELTFEDNKIYNLGTLEAKEVDAEIANITIDGNFDDWADVKVCVATFPEGDTYKPSMKTMKAYADNDNVYLYVEFEPAGVCYLDVYFDLDGLTTTGGDSNRWDNKADIYTEGRIYNWDSGEQVAYEYLWPSMRIYDNTAANWTNANEVLVTKCAAPVVISDQLSAVEWSIARNEAFNALIVGDTIYVGAFMMNTSWSAVGFLPKGGSMLAITLPAAE